MVPAGDSLSLALDAPAKVNLYLHVTGRRADGYHLLESLVAFAAVADRLHAEPAAALSLETEGPFAADLAAAGNAVDNLVLRAARALQSAAGVTAGARLRLIKRLPVAAGLGGGSADAAAALRLLACLWDVPDAADVFARIAPGLGADVPACLVSAPAVFSGIGEAVVPAGTLPGCGVLLVNAGEPVPTPAVFAARSGPFSPAEPWLSAAGADELFGRLRARANDLTAAAITVLPAIGEVLGELDRSPGCRLARMSGSGGTCFALYDSAEAAAQAADAVSDHRPGWWVAPTVFLDTAPAIERC